jgi:hypothetical protein
MGCFDVSVTRPAMFACNSIGSSASDRGCSLDAMEGKFGVARTVKSGRRRRCGVA